MAYGSQFVLAILHDGSPVREINGKVHLPFHSEYKVRVKNKHGHLRAKARIWIDGRQVSNLGDFILSPGQSLDLERFLDESMHSGNRFKFVPLSDSRVNDPTDSDNGIVKIEFYRELDNFWNPPVKITPIPYRKGFSPTSAGPYNGPEVGHWVNLTGTSTSPSYTTRCYNNADSVSLMSSSMGQPGATVDGAHSNQSFTYGSDFQTELYPVTLTLQIRGIERGPRPPRRSLENPVVVSPSKKERFCSNCGKRRARKSDVFCGRCGTPFKVVS